MAGMLEAVFAEGGAAPDRRRQHLCTPRARGGHASLPEPPDGTRPGRVSAALFSRLLLDDTHQPQCMPVCRSLQKAALRCPAAAQQSLSGRPANMASRRGGLQSSAAARRGRRAGPRRYLQEHADEPRRPPQPQSAPIAPYSRMTGGLWCRLGARRVKMDALQPAPVCMEPALRPPHGQARHGRGGS